MRLTVAIILINAAVFILQSASAVANNVPLGEDPFTFTFALTPVIALSGSWWQFISYMFLHADPLHIFLNMFVFFMFGAVMERALGWKKFLFLYMISGVGSALFYLFLTLTFIPGEMTVLMLGASGAVYGLLMAWALLYPHREILFMFIFPLPAKVFADAGRIPAPRAVPAPAISAVFLFAAVELIAGVTGIMPGIANFGHLGGIITAALMMLVWKYTLKPKNEKDLRHYQFYWE